VTEITVQEAQLPQR